MKIRLATTMGPGTAVDGPGDTSLRSAFRPTNTLFRHRRIYYNYYIRLPNTYYIHFRGRRGVRTRRCLTTGTETVVVAVVVGCHVAVVLLLDV